ncbi:MAG: hypothetical protein Q9170_002765 [Blastenia crenularia]
MATTTRLPKVNPKKLGFLDLPTEIRLEIYSMLLTLFHRKKAFTINIDKPEEERKWWLPFEKSTFPLRIEVAPRRHLSPSTVVHQPLRSEYLEDQPLSPEILTTCSTILHEASGILYGSNKFSFSSDGIDVNEKTMKKERFMKSIANLMSYSDDDWAELDCPKRPPLILRDSKLAAFIRKIGPANAALVRNLELCSWDTEEAAADVFLAAGLARCHFTGLSSFKVGVFEKEIFWEESPDYYHPDRSSPFWANGALEPMYSALEGFVDRVFWLQKFEYDTTSGSQIFFEETGALNKLQQLGCTVKKRAQKRKTTGEKSGKGKGGKEG